MEAGEFDESLEGIGMYLRGTVFNHPVFSTVLKFVEKIGDAHQREMDEDEVDLEKEMDRKSAKRNVAVKSLNQFKASSAAFADLPVPKLKKTNEQKKMS